ncbi:MAG: HAMP domain-containing histidine kinase [Chloroflexota bacterium]|nr:MAG: HAMP domain-containing histidine kinase [Chloroflexota bacterium]
MQRQKLPNSAKQTLELIAFLTYNFKSQLTSLNTSASLLAEKLASSHNDSETKLIGNIMASHHYLETIISELLALIKLQVDGLHLELEPTNIDALVHSVVDKLSPVFSSREQSLALNLAPANRKITIDSLRVEQILHNLLSNASKSTPTGGNICVSTDSQAGYVVIKIRDGSSSISNVKQNELFQPYCRLTGDKDTKVPGPDLGLALCKHLVELHGGRMWVENEEDNGNIFAFTLPLNNS